MLLDMVFRESPHWLLLSLAWCFLHSDVFPSHTTVSAITVRGLGATFPYAVYETWQAAYANERRKHKEVTISYDKTGSGAGRSGIINEPHKWDFAGTDTPLSSDELAQAPDLVIFPTVAGGVALAYHLPMCRSIEGKRLNLSMEHVVGIFNGTFTNWNDSALKALNPNCEFPDEKIRVVARAQKSGTTSLFTQALSEADQNWKDTYGAFSRGMDENTYEPHKWKPGVITHFGPKNEDVASLILSVRFTLGYMSAGDVQDSNTISVAGLVSHHGEMVTVTTESLQAAMFDKRNSTDLTVDLLNPRTAGAYPIASYTYLVFYRTKMQNCAVATELMRYVQWCMNQTAGKGFATLSASIVSRVTSEVLARVTCRGRSVLELVEEQIAEENRTEENWIIPVAVTVPVFMLVVGAMLGYILWQRIKLDKMINMNDWNIPIEDIVFFYDEKMQVNSQGKSKLLRQKSVKSLKSIGEISEGSELLSQILQWPGRWRANIIGIRLLDVVELKQLTRPMKKTMLWMRDSLINSNVVRFYGLTDLHDGRYVIEDFCSKGTVLDVLQNGKYNLNTDFKMSVALEIASGMSFLHVNNMVHGMLRSSCCWLDNKWTVKIGDWEYFKLLSVQNPNTNPLQSLRSKGTTGDKYELLFRDFWTAPELLRSELEEWPSQACDVYSYAIILQELFTRDDPYYELAEDLSPEQILDAVVHNRLRPEPSSEAPIIVRQVMELAWSDIPSSRPTFEQISKMLRRGRSNRKTIMDNMMEAMEDYMVHLEDEVEAKESALQGVKTSLDSLLADTIPPQVLASLTSGQKFESKIYPTLGLIMMETINFGITMETEAVDKALTMLDRLNTDLKEVCAKYQASCLDSHHQHLKTVVLGLDGETVLLSQRCQEVAHLALDLLEAAHKAFTDQHGKHKQLPVRLSAHVGTVGTGTIGVTSPKFLLLGSGLEVGRALLEDSELNAVKISRSLYSQIEKCPEFEFFSREPEWITCNGTDIEAYILAGRQAGSGQTVSSDTSVDSGVFMDGPGRASARLDTTGPSFANKAPTEPNGRRLARPALFLGGQPQQLDTGRGRTSATTPGGSVVSSSGREGTNRKSYSVGEGKRRASASDFHPTRLAIGAALPRIPEDSDTAHSTGELHQIPSDDTSHCNMPTGSNEIKSKVLGSNETGIQRNNPNKLKSLATEAKNSNNTHYPLHSHAENTDNAQGVSISLLEPETTLREKKHRQVENNGARRDNTFNVLKSDRDHKPQSHHRRLSRQNQSNPPLMPSTTQDSPSSSYPNTTELYTKPTVSDNHVETKEPIFTSSPRFLQERVLRPRSPDGISATSLDCASVKSGSSSCCESHADLSEMANGHIEVLFPPVDNMPRRYRLSPDVESRNVANVHQEVFVDIEHSPLSLQTDWGNTEPTKLNYSESESPRETPNQRPQAAIVEHPSIADIDRPSEAELQSRHRSNGSDGNKYSRKNNRVFPL